jgi:non-ribosomal peptide synthetase component F
MTLDEGWVQFVHESPNRTAIRDARSSLTYGELDRLANRIANRLGEMGVEKGQRVALWLPKSRLAVAAMQAVLRLGAAYVPIDPAAPPRRIKTLLEDCRVRVLVCDQVAESLAPWMTAAGIRPLVFSESLAADWLAERSTTSADPCLQSDDLAFILNTSGSTGIPKGTCISHGNALAFVRWALELLKPGPGDLFANHAPLHFDLSVLDVYGALFAGACVTLVPGELSVSPRQLVQFITSQQPTGPGFERCCLPERSFP